MPNSFGVQNQDLDHHSCHDQKSSDYSLEEFLNEVPFLVPLDRPLGFLGLVLNEPIDVVGFTLRNLTGIGWLSLRLLDLNLVHLRKYSHKMVCTLSLMSFSWSSLEL